MHFDEEQPTFMMDGVDFDIEKKAKPASSTTDKMQESYSNKHNVT
jgi:hypothetical protein